MPEHTSFFSYLLSRFPALAHNMGVFGPSLFGQPVTAHGLEPLVASAIVMLILVGLALAVRGQLVDYDRSVIPDAKLTLRTFFEVFVGFWYGTMKDMMGPKRAKRYFPLVGSLACFILLSNALGLIPGFTPPTSNWNVTMGCALVVFVMFNYYGFKENGAAYVKHLFGPYIGWWGIPINLLLFVIETVSTLIRPLTLSIRLMLNMAVDHLLVTLTLGMVALLLPIPVLVLSTLVVVVQVMVFCLLTSIYIALATEHDEHEADAKSHGVGAAHAAGAGF
ncbi:MAG TPA: F0F1 ATP synthase subunit A [Polyangiaceae bacterium]|nr:F0F1 ATP synthase subunit A [Polyangiaceae bacterium]